LREVLSLDCAFKFAYPEKFIIKKMARKTAKDMAYFI